MKRKIDFYRIAFAWIYRLNVAGGRADKSASGDQRNVSDDWISRGMENNFLITQADNLNKSIHFTTLRDN